MFVGGDEDRVQHGANHGGGSTLVLRAEALHFHEHLHVLNPQEGFLLGESEGAMERRDYPLLGHRSTGAPRVPGPNPADPGTGEPGGAPHGATRDALERTASCPKPHGGRCSWSLQVGVEELAQALQRLQLAQLLEEKPNGEAHSFS